MRGKLGELTRRYLPLEFGAWSGELGSAAATYSLTGSLAVAGVAAALGSALGYYLPAYFNAVRWWLRGNAGGGRWSRASTASLVAIRSLMVEFGPAESIDSVFVRPVLYLAAPMMLGNVVGGWIVGGLGADFVFYAVTLFSYERLGRWLVYPPAPEAQGADLAVSAP
jgi:hypothetical protein